MVSLPFCFSAPSPTCGSANSRPRGRAWTNGLSNADYDTNFCARWSGGRNFLKIGEAGSEVAIEPDGSVYPCCLKTRTPLGSLAQERLEDILASVAHLPAIQAINDGDPERMGEAAGWDRATFKERSVARDGRGRDIANPCLGCDAFFEEQLGEELRALRAERLGGVIAFSG
ncbi:MAG: SPASM domain-containing protein [Halioglobus sp.]|nr:SPASM domain-containing protein [Halioglobus sp.]